MKIKAKTIENDLEYLRQISKEVDLENDDYRLWIKELEEYCKYNAVYALAPVQIGIPKRLIYLKNTTSDISKNVDSNYNEKEVLINPVIIRKEGHTRFLERCASCLDFVGTVNRPYLIEVEYYDINGKKKKQVFGGFSATVISHEYDHLNGILHIDLASDVTAMTYEETKKYREAHPYEVIRKDGKFESSKLYQK